MAEQLDLLFTAGVHLTAAGGKDVSAADLIAPQIPQEQALCRELCMYAENVEGAYRDLAPHRVCQYLYSVAEAFNSFYHEVRILAEEDETKKRSWLALIRITEGILEQCMKMLGMEIPERM